MMTSLQKGRKNCGKKRERMLLAFSPFLAFLPKDFWVPRDSVVKCLTRNPGVLGSSLTGSSGFFRGSVLRQDTSEPSLVLVKPRKA